MVDKQYVYPRLDQMSLRSLLGIYQSDLLGDPLKIEEYTRSTTLAPERIGHKAVGVDRIGEGDLQKIREDLNAIALRHDYPNKKGSFTPYDLETARYLHKNLRIIRSDAGDRNVWSHFNGWLVPHLVAWRWEMDSIATSSIPESLQHRFSLGSRWFVRNQMGRLWWRVELLGDRYCDNVLGEDQVTGLFERTLADMAGRASATRRKGTGRSRRIETDGFSH